MSVREIFVSGSFDDIRSRQLRFLEEAAKLGRLTVLLWNDASVQRLTGAPPKFPEAEREYFLRATRFVHRVIVTDAPADLDTLPKVDGLHPHRWVVESDHAGAKKQFCQANRIELDVLFDEDLKGFPEPPLKPFTPGRKKVIVTGCYDWVHSGHVRFFEEVSTHGDVIACLGHDANIRLLKGEGHPLLPQDERRYLVGAIKYVTQALICTGHGWLDAEPEILRLKPDIYAVNEDGDKGGKREYCSKMGMEYLVLKRTPAPGLPKRSSTDLRGF